MAMVKLDVIGVLRVFTNRKMYHRIFILEGLLTVLVSAFAYFVVPTWSYKAKFVSDHTFILIVTLNCEHS